MSGRRGEEEGEQRRRRVANYYYTTVFTHWYNWCCWRCRCSLYDYNVNTTTLTTIKTISLSLSIRIHEMLLCMFLYNTMYYSCYNATTCFVLRLRRVPPGLFYNPDNCDTIILLSSLRLPINEMHILLHRISLTVNFRPVFWTTYNSNTSSMKIQKLEITVPFPIPLDRLFLLTVSNFYYRY